MAQFNSKKTSQAALLMSIAAAFPLVVHGAPAARVDFASGNVTAVSPSGQARPLSKGAQLEQGETIATNTGRAQLRFTDGAYVSLQPQSEFRIDQYRFAGTADGNEKGVFSLIKGGLRTITGLVGRSNKKNYQINTAVATIGIRGTEYTIQYGQSITGTVGEGEIEVCNGAGCLNVTNGESYYVQNQDVKPELTNKGTDLPPAPPESPPQKFAENENVDQSGELCTLFPAQCLIQPAGTGTMLTGTISPIHVGATTSNFGQNVYMDSTATFNPDGTLASFDDFNFSGTSVLLQGPYANTGNDGIIAWGRASGASGGECCGFYDPANPLHYVAGIPVDIGTLGDLQATYTLLGATQPTGTLNGAVGGTLDSMTMTALFPTGTVTGSMIWTLESQALSATFSGGPDGQIFASGATNFSGSVFLQGFFAGDNAARAGFVYEVSDTSLSQNYVGSAALTQTSLVPAPLAR